MNVKADAFLLKGVDQLGSQSRQIDTQALHPIIEIGIDRFHHCISAAVIDIDSCHTTRFHIVKEASVAHARDGCVARSHSGASGLEVVDTSIAEKLPRQQQCNCDRESPEKNLPPALIHGIKEDPTNLRAQVKNCAYFRPTGCEAP